MGRITFPHPSLHSSFSLKHPPDWKTLFKTQYTERIEAANGLKGVHELRLCYPSQKKESTSNTVYGGDSGRDTVGLLSAQVKLSLPKPLCLQSKQWATKGLKSNKVG